jgi:hypothetical protein
MGLVSPDLAMGIKNTWQYLAINSPKKQFPYQIF